MSDPYESIKDAVEWMESAIPIIGGWEFLRDAAFSPSEIVARCARASDKSIALSDLIGLTHLNTDKLLRRARPQMDLPIFLTWVSGKLGCM